MITWHSAHMGGPRRLPMLDVVRYDRTYSPIEVRLGDFWNFWWLQDAPGSPYKRIQLESGINPVAFVEGPDASRRPLIALRSSPWKAGQESTPWHDEFDLNHGHVRYFGDHKVSTLGPVGTTPGNRALLDAWRLHASGKREERLLAPPLILFRAVPIWRDGRRVDKGHVEFCGVGVLERLEHIVQRDPGPTRQGTQTATFPNIVVDINVVTLDENDEFDFRWLDDRRDWKLTAEESLRFAPKSWIRWVDQGKVALPRIRRRVLSSRVQSRAQQLPEIGSAEEQILELVYRAFDQNKHAFEWLASRIAEQVLSDSGARYSEGWLTRAGGDGGMDFVGRLDVGSTRAQAPLVVLGQAKCVAPSSTISADQVARVVARLRRGWLGVYVTTGHFSERAQIEVVDDEYPLVMVPGRVVAEVIHRLAEESFEGDVQELLDMALTEYPGAVTHRRPEEILGAG